MHSYLAHRIRFIQELSRLRWRIDRHLHLLRKKVPLLYKGLWKTAESDTDCEIYSKIDIPHHVGM